MVQNKYTFGQPSIMKAIEPGQKATFKFLDQPKLVETEWGEKFSVDILLLSHPLYSITSSKGIKMTWQTGAKVIKDIIDLLKKKKHKIILRLKALEIDDDFHAMVIIIFTPLPSEAA